MEFPGPGTSLSQSRIGLAKNNRTGSPFILTRRGLQKVSVGNKGALLQCSVGVSLFESRAHGQQDCVAEVKLVFHLFSVWVHSSAVCI